MKDVFRLVALRLCIGARVLPCALLLIACAICASNLRAQTPAPSSVTVQRADRECLLCHTQKGLQSAAGKSVYVNEATHQSGAHAKLSCTECHSDIRGFPHPEHIRYAQCSTCHAQEAQEVPGSVHAVLGDASCASCHGVTHDVRRAAAVAAQLCGACHTAERTEFLASAHGVAMSGGDK
jgi:hypothetical protein